MVKKNNNPSVTANNQNQNDPLMDLARSITAPQGFNLDILAQEEEMMSNNSEQNQPNNSVENRHSSQQGNNRNQGSQQGNNQNQRAR